MSSLETARVEKAYQTLFLSSEWDLKIEWCGLISGPPFCAFCWWPLCFNLPIILEFLVDSYRSESDNFITILLALFLLNLNVICTSNNELHYKWEVIWKCSYFIFDSCIKSGKNDAFSVTCSCRLFQCHTGLTGFNKDSLLISHLLGFYEKERKLLEDFKTSSLYLFWYIIGFFLNAITGFEETQGRL